MASKKGGLANYAKAKKTDTSAQDTPTRQKRGAGPVVTMNMRMVKADWMRLHALALDESTSLQALFIEGLTLVFQKRGLPAMEKP